MPLLWALRDVVGLTGTKYGCGMALCGACTVHLDGEPVRSCVTTVSAVEGRSITTIEGLSRTERTRSRPPGARRTSRSAATCQAGQIMSAAALLASNLDPSDAEIEDAMSGNLCRCGTYVRIRRAIRRAATISSERRSG